MPSSATPPLPAEAPLADRLALAALGTAAAVWLLCLTEEFAPQGSAVGWLAMLLIVAAHLPLLAGRTPRLPLALPAVPSRGLQALALLFVLLAAGTLAHRHHSQIAGRPVYPEASAQMGLLTQVTARLDARQPIYTPHYRTGAWSQRNAFPPLLATVYTLQGATGLEWRYAPLAAVVLLAGLLAAALAALPVAGRADGRTWLLLGGTALAASSWLFPGRFLDFLHWGHAAVLWPLLFLLGWSLGRGWWLPAAGAAGLLGGMNAGWLLLLPLVGVVVWKAEKPAHRPALLALLLLPPLLSYGLARAEWEEMWSGITGTLFGTGLAQVAEGSSSRFPTLHGLTDPFALRVGIYGLAVGLLGWMAMAASRAKNGRERLLLLAAGAALVIAAAPASFYFHWAAHALLLAGLALGLAGERHHTARRRSLLLGGGAAVSLFLLVSIRLYAGFPDALNRPETAHRQDHFQHLLAGFNIPSQDHVWGRDPRMVTAFLLDRAVDGILEIDLATPGGEFTPFNPALIRVNGRPVGLYRELPGRSSFARVPLRAGEVHAGMNLVEIEARWARTPRSLGLADDERDVSLMYRGLRFIPVRAIPTTEGAAIARSE